MESGHHCPFVGLKQNRSIRFASPTPEHRCYVTGEPQEIPVEQEHFCLSRNHINCPLYTGETVPSIEHVAPVAIPVPATGIRGWFAGLSERDRRIYMALVGLLSFIIIGYIISGIFLFANDDPSATGDTPTATLGVTEVAPTSVPSDTPVTPSATDSASSTPAPSTTAEPSETVTPTRRPSVTPTRRPTATTGVVIPPTNPPFIPSNTPFVPTNPPFIPSNTPFVPTNPPFIPSNTPFVPSDTPVIPSDTPELPTITTQPPTAVPPTVAPTEIPTAEPTIAPTQALPPTEDLPSPIPFPTPAEGGRGEPPAAQPLSNVTLYFSDPSGRVLVPVTKAVAPTRYPRAAALEALLKGPASGLSRVVPSDTRVLDLRFEGNTAYVNFNRLPTYGNSGFSDLGLRSIILILTEYSEITQVQVQVQGENLGALRYRPNINPDNPQQLDGQWDTTSFLPLYFPLREQNRYVRVMRLVPKTVSLAQITVEGLIAGPGPYGDVLGHPIASSTKVERLVIVNGNAEVALSRAFLDSPDPERAVKSLVLALTTFDSVQRVTLTVDGKSLDVYWGAAYRGPFTRPTLNAE